MQTTPRKNVFARATVAALTTVSLTAAAGCADTGGDDQGVDQEVQEQIEELQNEVDRLNDRLSEIDSDVVYDGLYGEDFAANVQDYDDREVAVSGTVEQVVSRNAFTLGGDGVADLLVISAEGNEEVQQGDTVKVTGTAHATFDLPAVEDDIGRDLDDAQFEEWDQGPYVAADQVETDVEPTVNGS